MKGVIGTCPNCRQDVRLRARGLCWRCHEDPAVRGRYPARTGKALATAPTRAVREGTRPACRHCGLRVANRTRGKLCVVCVADPDVRGRHTDGPRACARCGFRHVGTNAPPGRDLCNWCERGVAIPERIALANALLATVGVGPVAAPAHSPKRLAVLIARSEAGLGLWNPDDDLEGGT